MTAAEIGKEQEMTDQDRKAALAALDRISRNETLGQHYSNGCLCADVQTIKAAIEQTDSNCLTCLCEGLPVVIAGVEVDRCVPCKDYSHWRAK